MSEGSGMKEMRWNRDAIIGLVSILVVAVLIFLGISLSHANDDYVCNANNIQDQQHGECTNGSWGPWTGANGVEQRTYTGTQSSVSFTGGDIVSCSHPNPSQNVGTAGTIVTTNTVCEIVEVQNSSDTGSGAVSGSSGTAASNGGASSTSSYTQTESVGAVINSAQTTGSYTDYQNYVEATLATSSISVSPVLVKQGATTQVIWSADHVVSCTVAGTNGDSWSGLQSPAQGQTSGAITAQTVYTLDCTTAIKTHLVSQATVQVIPTFQEK